MNREEIIWGYFTFLFMFLLVFAYPVVPYLIPYRTFFVILMDYTVLYTVFFIKKLKKGEAR